MAEHDIRHSAGARAGERAGHAVSALAFIAMTALWAYIVRNDPYYSSVQVFGVTLPVKTAGYLTILPLTGYIIGRWRYRSAPRRAALPALASALAGVLHFLYSHILLVLFTGAVAVRTFVGWDMDEAVRSIDDRLFDIAARFAPWVSAYLAGFSIGRFFGAHAAGLAAAPHASDLAFEAIGGPGDRRAHGDERAEPVVARKGDVARKKPPPADRLDRVQLEEAAPVRDPNRKPGRVKKPSSAGAKDLKEYRPRYSRLR